MTLKKNILLFVACIMAISVFANIDYVHGRTLEDESVTREIITTMDEYGNVTVVKDKSPKIVGINENAAKSRATSTKQIVNFRVDMMHT